MKNNNSKKNPQSESKFLAAIKLLTEVAKFLNAIWPLAKKAYPILPWAIKVAVPFFLSLL